MYFLPEDEIKSCSLAHRLEKSFKLMRVINLPETRYPVEHVTRLGSDYILYHVEKFNRNGIVFSYSYKEIYDSFPMYWWHQAIESRPIVQEDVKLKDRYRKLRKFKISFFDVSRNVSQEFLLKDVFGVGCRFDNSTILTRSNYIAVFIKFFRKSKSKTSRETTTERSLDWLFLLFKIQSKCDYYECVEISRINLKDYIEDLNGLKIEDMVYNQTEEQILLQFRRYCCSGFGGVTSELNLVLYDIKTRSVLQTFLAFKTSMYSFFQTYFVDHVDFEGGIIIALLCYGNETKMFSRNGVHKFTLFKSLSFRFNNQCVTDHARRYCMSNSNSQLLFFVPSPENVAVHDLFDISNDMYLPISRKVGEPFEVRHNKTGEELYICRGKKSYIYLHKPMFKSLTLLSASVVSKTYTKSDLTKMGLPRQLYKYLKVMN